MANYFEWINNQEGRRYKRVFGKPYYQNVTWDRGNYSNGFNIGTSRSISAENFIQWRGYQKPTTQAQADFIKREMQNLSPDEAVRFYKPEIWDKVRGDQFNNQVLAEFAADMQSSVGYRAAKFFNRALFKIGYNVPQNSQWSVETLKAANNANAQELYRAFYDEMHAYYDAIKVEGEDEKPNRFVKDLNQHYPRNRSVGASLSGVSFYRQNKAAILIFLGLVGLVYTYKRMAA